MRRLVKGGVNTATGPQGRTPIMRSQKKGKIYNKKWRFTIGIGDMNTHAVTFTKSALYYFLSFSEDNECCLAVLWFYERE